MNLQHS